MAGSNYFAMDQDPLDIRRFMTSAAQLAGDGATDCHGAIQSAADALPDNEGGILFVPRGNWRVAGTLRLKPKTILVGEGWASLLNFEATANGQHFIENRLAAAGPDGRIELRDLNLNLSNPTAFHTITGIDLGDRSSGGTEHASYCRLQNVKLTNWNWRAIAMSESTISFIDQCEFQSIKNLNHASQPGTAWPVYIAGTGNGVTISRCHITGSDGAIRVAGVETSAALSVRNCSIEAAANYANPYMAEHVFIEGAASFTFQENYLEGLATGPAGGPGTDAVIRLKNVAQARIAQNYMQGRLDSANVVYRHLRVEGTCRNVVIEQNDIENPTNSYAIVELGAEDTIIRNNRYVFGEAADTNIATVRSRINGVLLLEDNEYTQSVAYASTLTPNARNGKHLAVGALTGAMTIGAPTNAPNQPGMPRELVIELVQDAAGGRAVSLNTVFRSNYTATGNTANKRNLGRFTWDGANWVGGWSGWF